MANWWTTVATFAGVATLGFILEYLVNKRLAYPY